MKPLFLSAETPPKFCSACSKQLIVDRHDEPLGYDIFNGWDLGTRSVVELRCPDWAPDGFVSMGDAWVDHPGAVSGHDKWETDDVGNWRLL